MWVWGKVTAIPSRSLVHPGRDQPESWISDKGEEENLPRTEFKENPGGHRHDRTRRISRLHRASALCSLSTSDPDRVEDDEAAAL